MLPAMTVRGAYLLTWLPVGYGSLPLNDMANEPCELPHCLPAYQGGSVCMCVRMCMLWQLYSCASWRGSLWFPYHAFTHVQEYPDLEECVNTCTWVGLCIWVTVSRPATPSLGIPVSTWALIGWLRYAFCLSTCKLHKARTQCVTGAHTHTHTHRHTCSGDAVCGVHVCACMLRAPVHSRFTSFNCIHELMLKVNNHHHLKVLDMPANPPNWYV